MKTLCRFALPFVLLPTLALAVYAPIPEQEQGKPLTFRVGTSAYQDSNIFGAASGEISSMVYNFTGAISYNGSIDDQTFASASYELSNDYETDRPGTKNLTNHSLNARLAHSFSSASNIDVSGAYNISQNPQSLLNGVPLNTDQSLKRGQFDARYTTAAGQKTGVVVKYRYIDYSYDDATLGTNLDHSESLAGLELSYALLPETKLVGEYRYQSINYRSGSSTKDKTSNFLMGGVDYNPGKDLLVSTRAGFESRHRDSEPNATAPYVELSTRYTYAEGSFLAVGYTYTIEEPSDIVNYTDTNVNRFFANVQHRLTGTITASGSLTYEPSRLQGRGGVHVDINETTTRFGLGLSWQPTKNWTADATYDLDDINSDDPNRGQNRTRFGVSARYTF
jgi:opacity protein-like surface antigen